MSTELERMVPAEKPNKDHIYDDPNNAERVDSLYRARFRSALFTIDMGLERNLNPDPRYKESGDTLLSEGIQRIKNHAATAPSTIISEYVDRIGQYLLPSTENNIDQGGVVMDEAFPEAAS